MVELCYYANIKKGLFYMKRFFSVFTNLLLIVVLSTSVMAAQVRNIGPNNPVSSVTKLTTTEPNVPILSRNNLATVDFGKMTNTKTTKNETIIEFIQEDEDVLREIAKNEGIDESDGYKLTKVITTIITDTTQSIDSSSFDSQNDLNIDLRCMFPYICIAVKDIINVNFEGNYWYGENSAPIRADLYYGPLTKLTYKVEENAKNGYSSSVSVEASLVTAKVGYDVSIERKVSGDVERPGIDNTEKILVKIWPLYNKHSYTVIERIVRSPDGLYIGDNELGTGTSWDGVGIVYRTYVSQK